MSKSKPWISAQWLKGAPTRPRRARAVGISPYVPFGQWFQPVAHSPKLKGLPVVPGVMAFWNVEKQ
jgi:hypothetical protein